MGDAIAHSVLPGVVIAYIVGIPIAIGAFIAAMISAIATGFLMIIRDFVKIRLWV